MHITPTRRGALGALALLTLLALMPFAVSCGGARPDPTARPAAPRPSRTAQALAGRFAALERAYDARLGVYAVDTGTGREIAYRDGERFPYASTFKALAAAAVLRTHSPSAMNTVIRYSRRDLVDHSPVTAKHLASGMTLTQLCDAAMRFSDNTAANLLLDAIGGPEGLAAALRKAGDRTTVMNQGEPEVNDWAPGASRNTTTPRALAADLRTFDVGNALGTHERDQLTGWLRGNTTGGELIRAGVPKGWTVGDRSGAAGVYGVCDDIAVVRPPGRAPVVIVVMSSRSTKQADYDSALIARAASLVTGALA